MPLHKRKRNITNARQTVAHTFVTIQKTSYAYCCVPKNTQKYIPLDERRKKDNLKKKSKKKYFIFFVFSFTQWIVLKIALQS